MTGLTDLIRLGQYLGIMGMYRMEELVCASVPEHSLDGAIDAAFDVIRNSMTPDGLRELPHIMDSSDLSRLAGLEGDRRELLARDVYVRLVTGTRNIDECPDFEAFDLAFRECLERLELVLRGALSAYGITNEIVSLEHPAAGESLDELKHPGCRKFGELWPQDFSAGRQTATIARYIETLLDDFHGKGLDFETCTAVKRIMDHLTAYPRYFAMTDQDRRMEAAQQLVRAMTALRSAPGAGSKKDDLLAALSLMLYGIMPSKPLIKYMTMFRPGPASRHLQHEHNAVMAFGFLLLGKCELALTFAEKAAETASEPAQRVHVRLLEGCTHLHRREYEKAANAIERALKYANSPKARSHVKFYLGLVKYELGDIRPALKCFEEARKDAMHETDIMAACTNIGTCHMRSGNLSQALVAFEDAENNDTHSDRTTMKEIRSIISGNAGIVYLSMREYEAALDNFKRALRVSREIGNYRAVAHNIANIGLAHKGLHNFPDAVRHFTAALHYSCNLNYLECARFSHDQVLQLLALQGQYSEAARLEREVIRRHPGIAGSLGTGHPGHRDR